MNARELMDILEQRDDEDLYSMEVHLAQQPAWPLEFEAFGAEIIKVEGKDVLYIKEGNPVGYLPQEVCNTILWN